MMLQILLKTNNLFPLFIPMLQGSKALQSGIRWDGLMVQSWALSDSTFPYFGGEKKVKISLFTTYT